MILTCKFTTLNFLLFRSIHAYFCLRNFDFYFCKSVVASLKLVNCKFTGGKWVVFPNFPIICEQLPGNRNTIKSQSLKTVVKSYKQWGNT